MKAIHQQTREGDEIVCSCGLRWGLDEEDPHKYTGNRTLKQIKESLDESDETEKPAS